MLRGEKARRLGGGGAWEMSRGKQEEIEEGKEALKKLRKVLERERRSERPKNVWGKIARGPRQWERSKVRGSESREMTKGVLEGP